MITLKKREIMGRNTSISLGNHLKAIEEGLKSGRADNFDAQNI